MLSLATKENPFKQEKREFPIDFSFPFENISTTIINLPEGYRVESIPEAMAMQYPQIAVGEVEKVAPALLDIVRRTLERVEDASHQL